MKKRSFSQFAHGLPFCPVSLTVDRIKCLSDTSKKILDGDCIVYWMSRDQRAFDNYALLCAADIAKEKQLPVRVVFNLVPKFLSATIRQYAFMIEGLKEVEATLSEKNVPFTLLFGDPVMTIPQFLIDVNAVCLVTDFSPMKISRLWIEKVASKFSGATFQVDAHNIVPCLVASDRLEYAARTIRPKIMNKLNDYLVPFPPFTGNGPDFHFQMKTIDWDAALASLEIDRSILPVDWIKPGSTHGMQTLAKFSTNKLARFVEERNNPLRDVASNLSPYFHFGQLCSQTCVLYLKNNHRGSKNLDSFIEEAVVRKELADNFCYYSPNYDSLDGCYAWALETLRTHSKDKRDYVYSLEEFERGETHDDLWNAAQLQMVEEGKMHGFLRMYWAKKILEWSSSPEEALRIALYLNDRYQLDGRDPNGYVGCMWSIGGIHDQGWSERAIFGKIRYMNYEGCKRKFDVKSFVSRYPKASINAKKCNSSRK